MTTSTVHPSRYGVHPHRGLRLHIDPAALAVGLFLAALAVGAALVIHFAPIVPADGLYFVT